MINLFIDTNIYLNFYYFSEEDLKKLGDLQTLINKTNEIKLFVPSQIVDEYIRNRENKIKDALQRFEEATKKLTIPNLCSGYSDEIKEIKKYYSLFLDNKKKLIEKLKEDIRSKNLHADKIIQDLFSKSKEKMIPAILSRATLRSNIGNPPGKNGSYGDAINWEFLLNEIPSGEDLYFISDDKDYVSQLDENVFLPFLFEEWQKKKDSEIFFYKSLNKFFKDKFPDIELVDEYIKDIKIKKLSESYSFDNARANIVELYKINDFSDNQINKIVEIAINNDQIYNAHQYSPSIVGKRLESIINGHESNIPYASYEDFCNKFNITPKITLGDLFELEE
jgi:hypothetical protein